MDRIFRVDYREAGDEPGRETSYYVWAPSLDVAEQRLVDALCQRWQKESLPGELRAISEVWFGPNHILDTAPGCPYGGHGRPWRSPRPSADEPLSRRRY